MSGEANGRLKFTWQQVAWGIAMIVAVVGGWADIRHQVAMLRQDFSHHEKDEARELDRLWEAVKQADAAVPQRPKSTRGE